MRRVLLPLALLLLGACAQLETRVPPDVQFDLAGRLAVRYGGDGFSGSLAWRHAGSADELLIMPMTSITGTPLRFFSRI